MTLELGGQITITCEKTGYSAQLEFKLKVEPHVLQESRRTKTHRVHCDATW